MAMQTTEATNPSATNGSAAHQKLLDEFELFAGPRGRPVEVPDANEPPDPSAIPQAKTLLHRRLQALIEASESTNDKIQELVSATTAVACSIDALTAKIGGSTSEEGGEPCPIGEIPLTILRCVNRFEQLLLEGDPADPTKKKGRAKVLDELRTDQALREALSQLGLQSDWDAFFADIGDAPSADNERMSRINNCHKLRARVLRGPSQRR